jgi:hypothetical protein
MSEETQQKKTKSDSSGSEKEGLNLLSKAAETIAGDNKLLGSILKFILSPLGLIALLCGVGYLIWKNKIHKDRIADLEKELQKEIEAAEKFRKRKQIIDFDEEPEALNGIDYPPINRFQQRTKPSFRNNTIQLD